MIFVRNVKSSLKGGVDVTLGPRTVLYGPNGSGKSSVIQAIELGTGGYVSDMEGRDRVKSHHALARLFAPDNHMFSEVILSDDTRFFWDMKPGTKPGSFKKPDPTVPRKVRWPFQELSDTLGGEGSTVKAWLESKVVGNIAQTDLLGALPANLHNEIKLLIRREGKSDFLSLGKVARATAKSLRSTATRKEKTVDEMTQGIPTPLLASEREELEKELTALTRPRHGGYTHGQLESLKDEAKRHAALYVGFQEAHDAIPDLDESISATLEKIKLVLQLIASHQDHAGLEAACWVCGEGGGQAIQDRAAKLHGALETLKPQHDQAMKKAMLGKSIGIEYERVSALSEKLKNAVLIEDHSPRKTELVRRLAEDKATRQAWDNASSVKAEVSQMRKRAAILTEAGTELEKAGEALLRRRKAKFESEVTSLLPMGDVLGVDLASTRVGLVRGGQLHSALSGAEWSRVLLALSVATTDGSTPCVLAPPDRAWDRDTLTEVMKALNGSSAQIILMSTVKPDPVEGWSLVEL